VGGTPLYGAENKLGRLEALRLYTLGSAKLSREENRKGSLSSGMYADMAVLSEDYFTVPEDSIKNITSLLTILGGQAVYAAEEFSQLHQGKELPVSPDWAPVGYYGGYYLPSKHDFCHCHRRHLKKASLDSLLGINVKKTKPLNPWSFGCDCFAY
jgi:hypothetical protein